MRSRYSRCSSEFKRDGRGTSNGDPRSTKSAQRPSHARLPLTAEGSPSVEGFERLSNSLPILSACLSKNRCRTMKSVSSEVVPSHSSLSSSALDGEYFCQKYSAHYRQADRPTYMEFTEEASDIGNVPFQKIVENHHVRFFAKHDIIGKILDDLRDYHEPTAKYCVMLLRQLYVHQLRRHNGGGDEAEGLSICCWLPEELRRTAGI